MDPKPENYDAKPTGSQIQDPAQLLSYSCLWRPYPPNPLHVLLAEEGSRVPLETPPQPRLRPTM